MKRYRVAYYTSRSRRIDQHDSTDAKKVYTGIVTTVHTIYVWATDAAEALAIANGLDYVKELTDIDQIRVE